MFVMLIPRTTQKKRCMILLPSLGAKLVRLNGCQVCNLHSPTPCRYGLVPTIYFIINANTLYCMCIVPTPL